MKANEYRILQFEEHRFIIQIKIHSTKGFWWWKKEVCTWKRTNTIGEPWRFIPHPCIRMLYSEEFDILATAKAQIKKWRFETIIHDV